MSLINFAEAHQAINSLEKVLPDLPGAIKQSLSGKPLQLRTSLAGLQHVEGLKKEHPHLHEALTLLDGSIQNSIERQADVISQTLSTHYDQAFERASGRPQWKMALDRLATGQRTPYGILRQKELMATPFARLRGQTNATNTLELLAKHLKEQAKQLSDHSSHPDKMGTWTRNTTAMFQAPHLIGPYINTVLEAAASREFSPTGHNRNIFGQKESYLDTKLLSAGESFISELIDYPGLLKHLRMNAHLGIPNTADASPEVVKTVLQAASLQAALHRLSQQRPGNINAELVTKVQDAVRRLLPESGDVEKLSNDLQANIAALRHSSNASTWHHLVFPADVRSQMNEHLNGSFPVPRPGDETRNWTERLTTTLGATMTGKNGNANAGVPVQAHDFLANGSQLIRQAGIYT